MPKKRVLKEYSDLKFGYKPGCAPEEPEEKPDETKDEEIDLSEEELDPGEKKRYRRLAVDGFVDENALVQLNDESRLTNGLMIIGTKGTGKSEMLPAFFYQDITVRQRVDNFYRIPNSNASVVYIVSKRDQAYLLYAFAQKYHRTSTLVKPSADFHVANDILGASSYDYDKMNQFVDFEDNLSSHHAFIVDMEVPVYGEQAKIAVGMILMQLQIAMHKTDKTARRRVYLVIDDAGPYMPYLEGILNYGSDYNISTTLIFQSRNDYKGYEGLVESNIQNVVLMPNLVYEDAEYFSKNFCLGSPKDLMGRGPGNIFCSFMNGMKRENYETTWDPNLVLIADDQTRLVGNANKYKRQMTRADREELYAAKVQREYAKYILEQNRIIHPGSPMDMVGEVTAQKLSRAGLSSPLPEPSPAAVPSAPDPVDSHPVPTPAASQNTPMGLGMLFGQFNSSSPNPAVSASKDSSALSDSSPAPSRPASREKKEEVPVSFEEFCGKKPEVHEDTPDQAKPLNFLGKDGKTMDFSSIEKYSGNAASETAEKYSPLHSASLSSEPVQEVNKHNGSAQYIKRKEELKKEREAAQAEKEKKDQEEVKNQNQGKKKKHRKRHRNPRNPVTGNEQTKLQQEQNLKTPAAARQGSQNLSNFPENKPGTVSGKSVQNVSAKDMRKEQNAQKGNSQEPPVAEPVQKEQPSAAENVPGKMEEKPSLQDHSKEESPRVLPPADPDDEAELEEKISPELREEAEESSLPDDNLSAVPEDDIPDWLRVDDISEGGVDDMEKKQEAVSENPKEVIQEEKEESASLEPEVQEPSVSVEEKKTQEFSLDEQAANSDLTNSPAETAEEEDMAVSSPDSAKNPTSGNEAGEMQEEAAPAHDAAEQPFLEEPESDDEQADNSSQMDHADKDDSQDAAGMMQESSIQEFSLPETSEMQDEAQENPQIPHSPLDDLILSLESNGQDGNEAGFNPKPVENPAKPFFSRKIVVKDSRPEKTLENQFNKSFFKK